MKYKKNGIPFVEYDTPNRCELCEKMDVCKYRTKRQEFEIKYPFYDIKCKYFSANIKDIFKRA